MDAYEASVPENKAFSFYLRLFPLCTEESLLFPKLVQAYCNPMKLQSALTSCKIRKVSVRIVFGSSMQLRANRDPL